MKSYKINRFVIAVFLVFLACSAYATPPVPECKLLQIYIDSNNRIFWNICNPADSLPKQLPIIKFPSDTTDCEINTIYFEHLIKGLKNKNRKLWILIHPHPNSHYSCFDKVFNEVYKFEKECMAQYSKNKENHSEQNSKSNFLKVTKIKPKISIARPYCINFASREWADRNDRIIDSVYKFYELDSSNKIANLVENQFSERLDNGYWDSEVDGELMFPYDRMPGKPKIGIPRPDAQDEVDF